MHFDPGIIRQITLPELNYQVLLQLDERGYILKHEHHVTLVTAASRMRIDEKRVKLLQEFADTITEGDLRDGLSSTLYEIEKPKQIDDETYLRSSIVIPIISETVQSQLAKLATDLRIDLPEPFLHVTIATKPTTEVAARGIGVENAEEWEKLHPHAFAVDWQV